ncbi:Stage V sporulation protein T [uncultured Ruminococcus sp.]|uniref:AbrB/MazE/SpoVT family DNA-binding domain-containing protein n=1 Tax=Massiliimalia timonensis TaxID=1987501 RepID=A0A8J6PL97_9FIRM|nr:stage V sporulation T C-terminal domain-containing protein [Massiliimalia timonensis]MBC8611720.1 AbrB/MazE/SpoVT family DNA-binding domain-containing protein [Massiliimalia timonensis]MBS7174780.1 AbrB/MazE/SpoVT family DNA-binding domain-containing protein [Clostridiales bacterium]SCH60203.1 Stage V sporulation protein T [uncultured Clostridium sp.]SCH73887.1 Stage V sporulation protein T [uncultured Ruminococcus sp.]
MKATGIVRRIDDLGRVVIPKEIRRTMRIREGTPLEIYTSGEGEVIFKKYSPVEEMGQSASQFAEALYKAGGMPAVICDKDHVIAASGIPKKEILERRVSPMVEDSMNARRVISYRGESSDKILAIEGVDRYTLVCYPILANSDVCGAVLFLSDGKNGVSSELLEKLAEAASIFLGKQLEDE